MIELILRLLAVDEYYNRSEVIEIAKGKYKLPMSIKEGMRQLKRKRKWQRQ